MISGADLAVLFATIITAANFLYGMYTAQHSARREDAEALREQIDSLLREKVILQAENERLSRDNVRYMTMLTAENRPRDH